MSSVGATSLTGRWRIVSMDLWDSDAIDLTEPGFIEFDGDHTGRFGFIAVQGWMDCRKATRDGKDCVEFTTTKATPRLGHADRQPHPERTHLLPPR
jgi:hypothetical protein